MINLVEKYTEQFSFNKTFKPNKTMFELKNSSADLKNFQEKYLKF